MANLSPPIDSQVDGEQNLTSSGLTNLRPLQK
jgi:hypothetical protein